MAGGGVTSTALVAEANAAQLFDGDTVVLRFGLFRGPDSDLTLGSIEAAHAAFSPVLGRRDAYHPTLWLGDAATAIAAAIAAPAGTYNVADEEPATNAEIEAALAAVVGVRELRAAVDEVPPHLAPVWRSNRVSSRRLQDATGWSPRVRAGTEGWSLIVRQALAA